jgi:hypothetical protein
MNLNLYLPPRSAHPPGVLTSLIIGMTKQIYALTTKLDNKAQSLRLLFLHLCNRGYDQATLRPLFQIAIKKAPTKKRKLQILTMRKDAIYILLTIHKTCPPPSFNKSSATLYFSPLASLLCRNYTVSEATRWKQTEWLSPTIGLTTQRTFSSRKPSKNPTTYLSPASSLPLWLQGTNAAKHWKLNTPQTFLIVNGRPQITGWLWAYFLDSLDS